MSTRFGLATIVSLLLWTPVATAFACEGKPIFQDQFQDDTGGWYMDAGARVENGNFILQVAAISTAKTLNATFSVKDADICTEVVWATGNISRHKAGLMFWADDYTNFYLLLIVGDGSVAIFRQLNGRWLTISNNTVNPAVRTNPGDVNRLRARVVGNLVSLWVNDVKIRDLRAQAPAEWQFGLYGESDEPAKEIEVHFKSVTVTSP